VEEEEKDKEDTHNLLAGMGAEMVLAEGDTD